MQTRSSPTPSVVLGALLMLLQGCEHTSLSVVAPPPTVPPLPATARQTSPPTFSERARSDMQEWQQRLTAPSSPASSASASTTP